jgi:hypothetical protein
MADLLELSGDVLTAPQRWHLAEIEVAMLWPDSKEARESALRSIGVEVGRDHIFAMEAEDLRHYAAIASSTRPLADIETEARFTQGAVVGLLLHSFVSCEGKKSLGEIRAGVCAALRGTKQLTPKTIENAFWPRFLSVSHLWAAFVGHAQETGDRTFPCRRAKLLEFLAISEFYRESGERLRAHKSPRAALLPGETILLPAAIKAALPSVEIRFEPAVRSSPISLGKGQPLTNVIIDQSLPGMAWDFR